MASIKILLSMLSLAALAPDRVAATPPGDGAARCGRLATLDLGPAVRLVSATIETRASIDADVNWAGDAPIAANTPLPAFCKVVADSMPSPTSRIRVELWLPLASWNERLLGIGNGGYPVAIDDRGMAAGLARGFATVSTDLGLAHYLPGGQLAPGGDITDVFIGNPIAIRDYATRATHEMTAIGKRLVAAFYGRPPAWSYFAGCSTGGMQAMSESQLYPADYDGILAGDPGGNRVRIHLGILWNFLAVWQRPERVLPDAKLKLLHDAAVAACLAQEGAPAGAVAIRRPQACRWTPETLRCAAGDHPSCLTAPQLAAAAALYSGPRNPRTGEAWLPGLLPGSELGWALYMKSASAPRPPYFGLFRAALGPQLDPAAFDWDRDAQTFVDIMGPQLDSADPDITAFIRRGGRLLFYHGGADPLVAVTDIRAYRRAAIALGTARAVDVAAATRLFEIPGMGHCRGGVADDSFDGLKLLQLWREQASPPARDDL